MTKFTLELSIFNMSEPVTDTFTANTLAAAVLCAYQKYYNVKAHRLAGVE